MRSRDILVDGDFRNVDPGPAAEEDEAADRRGILFLAPRTWPAPRHP
jgi:hypothetical protein